MQNRRNSYRSCTSVPFCHATPAGFVAHVADRGLYHTIASQMLIDSKLDVIIGCGNPYYDDNGNKIDTPIYKYISEQLYNDLKSSSGMLTDDFGNKEFYKVLMQIKLPMFGLLSVH